MTESDSEVSDCYEPSLPKASSFFDKTLDENYETVKEMISKRSECKWTLTQTVPNGSGKKPVNERITQVLGEASDTAPFSIQTRFQDSWGVLASKQGFVLSPETQLTAAQEEIVGAIARQQDLFFLCKRSIAEEAQHRALYSLQAMQLAMTARARILRELKEGEESRDQGFTRAQTLIILPFRNAAFDCVSVMASLWRDRSSGSSGPQVENWSRFVEEYSEPKPRDEEEAESLAEALRRDKRPEDFKHTFRGNIDDCFRIGIKFTRKSMKLFADFYSADVIIASPLGLRLIIDGADKNLKTGDFDFLSSIELLVIDQAEVLAMQNWEHLERVLAHLNRIPKKAHDCDFSRVKSAYLDGVGQKLRQSLVFSRFAFPELNACINNDEFFCNCSGAVKMSIRGAESIELLRRIAAAPSVPSFFLLPMRSEKSNPVDVMAASRFNFFCGKIVPALMRLYNAGHLPDGICILIPSYFDFCQVRAHMKKIRADGILPEFVYLSEYCSNTEIARARSKFMDGHAKIMLVTERFHFFRRYQIRGIRHLVFYGLPEFPEFFAEWLEMIGNLRKKASEEEDEISEAKRPRKLRPVREGELDLEVADVPVMIAPLDYLKLERIVGTERARNLLEMQS